MPLSVRRGWFVVCGLWCDDDAASQAYLSPTGAGRMPYWVLGIPFWSAYRTAFTLGDGKGENKNSTPSIDEACPGILPCSGPGYA